MPSSKHSTPAKPQEPVTLQCNISPLGFGGSVALHRSIVAIERCLTWLRFAHRGPAAEPVLPPRKMRGDGAPVILGEAEIGDTACAPRGNLAQVDVGAEVVRHLVET